MPCDHRLDNLRLGPSEQDSAAACCNDITRFAEAAQPVALESAGLLLWGAPAAAQSVCRNIPASYPDPVSPSTPLWTAVLSHAEVDTAAKPQSGSYGFAEADSALVH